MAEYDKDGPKWRFDLEDALKALGDALDGILDAVGDFFGGDDWSPNDPEFPSQGDGITPSDPGLGPPGTPNQFVIITFPIPPPQWTDVELKSAFSIGTGNQRNDLEGFDAAFQGALGTAFRTGVETVATEFGINPGLLASSALAEALRVDWLSTNAVTTTTAGLDYWGAGLRGNVISRVPAAASIPSSPTGSMFTNKLGVEVGPEHEFPNGQQALRAMAATLRYAEIRIGEWIGVGAWNSLPTIVQFMLVRIFFNIGPVPTKKEAKDAAAGKDILIGSGPVPDHPRRKATVRAAQAAHISDKFYGIPIIK